MVKIIFHNSKYALDGLKCPFSVLVLCKIVGLHTYSKDKSIVWFCEERKKNSEVYISIYTRGLSLGHTKMLKV